MQFKRHLKELSKLPWKASDIDSGSPPPPPKRPKGGGDEGEHPRMRRVLERHGWEHTGNTWIGGKSWTHQQHHGHTIYTDNGGNGHPRWIHAEGRPIEHAHVHGQGGDSEGLHKHLTKFHAMKNEQEVKRGRPAKITVTCPHCHGSGKDIIKVPGKTKPFEKPCPVCHGKGTIEKTGFKEPAKKEAFKEQAPVNSVGFSSSFSGPVQTYDPLLKKKLLKRRNPTNL